MHSVCSGGVSNCAGRSEAISLPLSRVPNDNVGSYSAPPRHQKVSGIMIALILPRKSSAAPSRSPFERTMLGVIASISVMNAS